MTFWRRSAINVMFGVFSMTLLTLGAALSLVAVMGHSSSLKSALHESGIYGSLIKDMLGQEQAKGETNSVPLAHPEVLAALERAFPPATLEKEANHIIDGTYNWLQGKTTTLEFRVDITEPKQMLASDLGKYAEQRLNGLPKCAPGVIPTELDPFQATCAPAGLNAAAAGEQVKQDILGSKGALEKNVITPDAFKDSSGESLTEQWAGAPQNYQNTISSLYVVGLVILLSAAAAVVLHQDKRRAVKRLGAIMLIVGAAGAVVAYGGGVLIQRAVNNISVTAGQNDLLQNKMTLVASALAQDVRNWWLGYSIAVFAVGLVIWLLVRFVQPKKRVIPTPTETPPFSSIPPSPPSAL